MSNTLPIYLLLSTMKPKGERTAMIWIFLCNWDRSIHTWAPCFPAVARSRAVHEVTTERTSWLLSWDFLFSFRGDLAKTTWKTWKSEAEKYTFSKKEMIFGNFEIPHILRLSVDCMQTSQNLSLGGYCKLRARITIYSSCLTSSLKLSSWIWQQLKIAENGKSHYK